MNYEQNLNLLRLYRIQNPVKYVQKYGDVPPEVAAEKLSPNKPFATNGVKVEIKPKETAAAVEVKFEEPKETYSDAGVSPDVVEKPKKRGRKKNG